MNTNDKQRMIEDLRARLQWLTFECEKEDTDAEVKAIIDLLDVLDPIEYDREYYSAEKSLERFWASERMQKVLAEEAVELAGKEVTEGKEEKVAVLDGTRLDSEESSEAALAEAKNETIQPVDTKESLKKVAAHKVVMGKFTALHKVAVAVILIAVMFLGGTIGAYAEKRGFFHKLSETNKRIDVITSPNEIDSEKDIHNSVEYFSLEEVPEKYLDYIWMPDEIPEDLLFSRFEITDAHYLDQVVSLYESDGKNRLSIICMIFDPEKGFYSSMYDSYEYYYEEDYRDRTIEYGDCETEDGVQKVAHWSEGNFQFVIKADMEQNELENIIKAYCDFVIENN